MDATVRDTPDVHPALDWWPSSLVDTPAGPMHVRHATPAHPGMPRVVLVHGLGGSATNWGPLAWRLRDDVDAYAIDLPGYGATPPRDGHTVTSHAIALAGYLRAAHSEPVHLVANSMGGLVAVLVAARQPEIVRSLLLISPAMPRLARPPREAALLSLLTLPRVGERAMARSAAADPEAVLRRIASVIYGDPERIDPEWFEVAIAERRQLNEQPRAGEVFLGTLRSLVGAYFWPWPVWRDVAGLRMPVRVVYGGRDRLVAEASRQWRRALPSVQLVHLPSSGHVAMMEQPDLVADLVREHLAQLARQPS